MKIKTFIAITMMTFTASLFAQELSVDTKKSHIKWTGKKVTGEHYGKLLVEQGSFKIENNRIISGKFTVDMSSITNEDMSGAMSEKLISHLKSDDFFATETFPKSTLVITGSVPFVNGLSKVKGDLTIKGKTHPVEFEVSQKEKVYTAQISVDRTLYDIRYRSGKFFPGLGDKMIYDNFDLEVILIVT